MIRQYELVERVREYDPQADEMLINRAYVFSMKVHGTQKRASGDPYFSHPLEVAGILTDMHLDTATIVTALLHDTIEDTVATYDEIEELFGKEVAQLVDGVTKLSKIEFDSEHARAAENFRKFLLAMSNDIRVLLVKLADRLHNMKTLHYIKDAEKRKRIALETVEIFAPLAERIGMQNMKEELEDLAFVHLNPDAHNSIIKRLEFLRENAGDLREEVIALLRETLVREGIEATIVGREKQPYSIWRKMQRDNISFEQLADIMAFRVIVADRESCYRTLGVVHGTWSSVPGRFRDYISTPKHNHYQSIHTTIMLPRHQRVEVQIRSQEMHRVAEFGLAAHWRYKQHAERVDGSQYRWIRELLEILENAENPEEFLEHTKLSMFQDQVFCFTPRGELITMPMGATPVDFAYAVHTEVGETCVGAKVNGRLVALNTRLNNGDQVEVIRSGAQTPSANWERFVVTGKARSAIRRFLRNQERAQCIELGRTIVQNTFRQHGHEFTEKALERPVKVLKFGGIDDVYVALGKGELTGKQVLELVFPGETLRQRLSRLMLRRKSRPSDRGRDHAIPIRGLLPGRVVHLGECCHPLPGDRIVGITMEGKGVTIHTIDCDALEEFDGDSDRWLDVAWDEDESKNGTHVGRLDVMLANEVGALNTLTGIIAKNQANISNLKLSRRTPDYFNLAMDIEVNDVKHLTDVVAALRATPEITSVERRRG